MDTRKGLGRGIASLIPVRRDVGLVPASTDASNATRPYQIIPITSLVPNPNQPRKFFDEEKIRELTQSIQEKGVLQPVIVTKKGSQYEIVSGERRFRAAQAAGLKEIPTIVREMEAAESLEIAIIENVQRQDLDPIEEASAYQELLDRFGYTQEQLAKRVGKERATVANMLRLLKLPLKIKQSLQSGSLSMGHARALLGVAEIEKQLYFADQSIAEGWSVRELEARIASKRIIGFAKKKPRTLASLPPRLTTLLDGMRRSLGTQVRLVPAGQKGKIIIEYYSEVDLDRVYSKIVH